MKPILCIPFLYVLFRLTNASEQDYTITVCTYTSRDASCSTGEECETQFSSMPCAQFCALATQQQMVDGQCGKCGQSIVLSTLGRDATFSCPTDPATAPHTTCYDCRECASIPCPLAGAVCGGACVHAPGCRTAAPPPPEQHGSQEYDTEYSLAMLDGVIEAMTDGIEEARGITPDLCALRNAVTMGAGGRQRLVATMRNTTALAEVLAAAIQDATGVAVEPPSLQSGLTGGKDRQDSTYFDMNFLTLVEAVTTAVEDSVRAVVMVRMRDGLAVVASEFMDDPEAMEETLMGRIEGFDVLNPYVLAKTFADVLEESGKVKMDRGSLLGIVHSLLADPVHFDPTLLATASTAAMLGNSVDLEYPGPAIVGDLLHSGAENLVHSGVVGKEEGTFLWAAVVFLLAIFCGSLLQYLSWRQQNKGYIPH
eukprot:CAMPEP_0194334618 /NCGR_PEP_ID=MMETSP0171-20130528/66689_1 /TAXON_ID=218684 /ORGANISM="Corethron pennatum, Strain L29A3" /LENGTH=423 /DNA_ID=CAMNT_0039097333 /DNA_START=89 /DNA_END=1360 /DNA_ORIENTATION=-